MPASGNFAAAPGVDLLQTDPIRQQDATQMAETGFSIMKRGAPEPASWRKPLGAAAVLLLHMALIYELVHASTPDMLATFQPPMLAQILAPPNPVAPPPAPVTPVVNTPPVPVVPVLPPPPHAITIAKPKPRPVHHLVHPALPTPNPSPQAQQPLAAPTKGTPVSAPTQAQQDSSTRCTAPAYPAEEQDEGIGGTVVLRLLISAGGQVENAAVQSSSGYKDLDRAALSALSLCKFIPGTEAGVPIDSALSLTYDFRPDTN
jgi:protein TonB